MGFKLETEAKSGECGCGRKFTGFDEECVLYCDVDAYTNFTPAAPATVSTTTGPIPSL